MSYAVGDVLYRAELVGWDHEDSCYLPDVVYRTWTVEKPTPCGAWILTERPPLRRWVRIGTRFASPTREEAVDRMVYRAHANVRRSEYRLERAQRKAATLRRMGLAWLGLGEVER